MFQIIVHVFIPKHKYELNDELCPRSAMNVIANIGTTGTQTLAISICYILIYRGSVTKFIKLKLLQLVKHFVVSISVL